MSLLKGKSKILLSFSLIFLLSGLVVGGYFLLYKPNNVNAACLLAQPLIATNYNASNNIYFFINDCIRFKVDMADGTENSQLINQQIYSDGSGRTLTDQRIFFKDESGYFRTKDSVVYYPQPSDSNYDMFFVTSPYSFSDPHSIHSDDPELAKNTHYALWLVYFPKNSVKDYSTLCQSRNNSVCKIANAVPLVKDIHAQGNDDNNNSFVDMAISPGYIWIGSQKPNDNQGGKIYRFSTQSGSKIGSIIDKVNACPVGIVCSKQVTDNDLVDIKNGDGDNGNYIKSNMDKDTSANGVYYTPNGDVYLNTEKQVDSSHIANQIYKYQDPSNNGFSKLDKISLKLPDSNTATDGMAYSPSGQILSVVGEQTVKSGQNESGKIAILNTSDNKTCTASFIMETKATSDTVYFYDGIQVDSDGVIYVASKGAGIFKSDKGVAGAMYDNGNCGIVYKLQPYASNLSSASNPSFNWDDISPLGLPGITPTPANFDTLGASAYSHVEYNINIDPNDHLSEFNYITNQSKSADRTPKSSSKNWNFFDYGITAPSDPVNDIYSVSCAANDSECNSIRHDLKDYGGVFNIAKNTEKGVYINNQSISLHINIDPGNSNRILVVSKGPVVLTLNDKLNGMCQSVRGNQQIKIGILSEQTIQITNDCDQSGPNPQAKALLIKGMLISTLVDDAQNGITLSNSMKWYFDSGTSPTYGVRVEYDPGYIDMISDFYKDPSKDFTYELGL